MPPLGESFAHALQKRLANASAENLFFSPASIRITLAMVAAGASGATRQEMVNVCALPGALGEQNEAFKSLLEQINGTHAPSKRPYELTSANAIWCERECAIRAAYAKSLETFYQAACRVVDFAKYPQAAAEIINAWCRLATHQKIDNLVNEQLVTEARMVLTNAIYFKGSWRYPFKKDLTEDQPFFGASQTRKAPLMAQQGKLSCKETPLYQSIFLPYEGDQIGMLIVLPKKKDGLDALEAAWGEGSVAGALEGMARQQVNLFLPRFKLETQSQLKSILRSMGMELSFSDAAHFALISEEPLKISEVVHKAFVDVNEEGTEAAAATGGIVTLCSASISEPVTFRADHPFLFFIRQAQTTLFAGRVNDL